jgi:carboxymethylenebutenolidase
LNLVEYPTQALQNAEHAVNVIRVLSGSVILAGLVTACHHSPRTVSADEHMAHMSAADLSAPPARSGTSQGVAGLPASNNNAAARIAASPRHGEWVKIAWEPGSSDSLMAWVVYPSTSRAKSPVVVVVHEIFGLSTWVRGVADQVAADGFIAIAPDLLSRARGGPSTDELANDSASKLARIVSSTDRNKGIASAARFAMSQTSAAPKYAVIGYCWGGATVFMHAVNGGITGYSGGVAYYGLPYMNPGQPGVAPLPNADSLTKITKPVMLLNGSKDQRIAAAMPAVDSAMKALKKDYSGTNYEGAVHGFLRQQDDPKQTRDEAEEKANLAAAKDAWPKTVAFLKKNLGVK